jgi:hypothetical protein
VNSTLCCAEVSAAGAGAALAVLVPLLLEDVGAAPEEAAAGEATEDTAGVPSEDIPVISPQAANATAIAIVAVVRNTAAVRVIILMPVILGDEAVTGVTTNLKGNAGVASFFRRVFAGNCARR